MTRLDLVAIANAGGSLEVNGMDYSRLDLVAVANALKPNATLKILNSGNKTRLDLIAISNAKKAQ